MKLIFVSGPFRGANHWEQERNIRRAEELSLEVWKLGAVGLCPHTNTRFFQGALPDDVWLRGDLEMLRRCDGMLLVSGWNRSRGATAEFDFACRRGIPVFTSLSRLKSWMNRRNQ